MKWCGISKRSICLISKCELTDGSRDGDDDGDDNRRAEKDEGRRLKECLDNY